MATDVQPVDLRQRVVNDLHPDVRALVESIDRMERAFRDGHLKPSLIEAVIEARSKWLDPIVARAEEGEL